MEKLNIILSDGVEKEVDCIFYLYNSKYYFIYTLKEIDENGYVILYLSQIGKEIKNTPNGPLETGYMVGVEINDDDEWKNVQKSISKIVEDSKNGTISPEIQYLPLNMITKLKIVSKKMFRLMKDIVVKNLNIDLDISQIGQIKQNETLTMMTPGLNSSEPSYNLGEPQYNNDQTIEESAITPEDSMVIIDYRSKYFEEQEKNNQLQKQIDELNNKIQEIKNLLN